MQKYAIELESNMMAANRLKGESDKGANDKKKQTSDDKFEEMSKMIKDLTSKMTKLEMEGKNFIRLIQE